MTKRLFVGLDVHKEKIAVGIAEEDRGSEVRAYGSIDNTPDALGKLLRKLSRGGAEIFACYEAGACGYNVYRQIVASGHQCVVVAPSRIPRPSGDRVKTDRRDAMMLARLHRSGDLTPVWVPDEEHEAMRDLVRSRIAAVRQRQVARQQLKAFLLRHGRIVQGVKSWSRTHLRWLSDQKFESRVQQVVFQDYVNTVLSAEERLRQVEGQIHEQTASWSMAPVVKALCTLRGVSTIGATSILATTGDLGRFESPRQLMAYFGLVPSERSSGNNIRRGGITKTGNNEVRRLLIQSAWQYRFPARVARAGVDGFVDGPAAARQIAWKAQLRLAGRYRSMLGKGKPVQVVITAIARELLAFIWAIGQVAPPARARA